MVYVNLPGLVNFLAENEKDLYERLSKEKEAIE